MRLRPPCLDGVQEKKKKDLRALRPGNFFKLELLRVCAECQAYVVPSNRACTSSLRIDLDDKHNHSFNMSLLRYTSVVAIGTPSLLYASARDRAVKALSPNG
jgi:hypothetical protein